MRGSTVGARDKDLKSRNVAQLGSAPCSGRGGRRFESCHSDFLYLIFPTTRSITRISPRSQTLTYAKYTDKLYFMLEKKILTILLLLSFIFGNSVFAATSTITGVTGSVRLLRVKKENNEKKEYKYKTVLKHYTPYRLTMTNNNSKPVLLSANTEVHFILGEDSEIISQSRRDIYRASRKRDMGRYYWLALPGAVIAGGITGITFFLGAPIAALVAVGMYVPTDKAVRTNVDIAQDLHKIHDMPIRIEPGKTYEVTLLAPKKWEVEKVKITNVSYDLKKMSEITFPVVSTEEKL